MVLAAKLVQVALPGAGNITHDAPVGLRSGDLAQPSKYPLYGLLRSCWKLGGDRVPKGRIFEMRLMSMDSEPMDQGPIWMPIV